MAKTKGDDTQQARGARKQVDIDEDLVVKMRTLAAQENQTTPDYVSNLLRPIIEKRHREYIKSEILKE